MLADVEGAHETRRNHAELREQLPSRDLLRHPVFVRFFAVVVLGGALPLLPPAAGGEDGGDPSPPWTPPSVAVSTMSIAGGVTWMMLRGYQCSRRLARSGVRGLSLFEASMQLSPFTWYSATS